MIWRLALRAALKHWKRSLVTAGAVAVACAVMISIGALLNGIDRSFLDSVVSGSGHIRVDDARAPLAASPLGLRSLLADADGTLAAIEGLADPRVHKVEKYLSFGALLVEDSPSGDPRNLAMRGIGVTPDTRFADNVRAALVQGAFLPGGAGILLSEAAARLVGTRLGGSVLVLVQDRSGQPWYESLTVTGLFRTDTKDFDETTFYIAEGKAAEMLDVAGQTREIRVLLRDRRDARKVAASIGALLAAAPRPGAPGAAGDTAGGAAADAAPPPTLRVMTWEEANGGTIGLLIFVNAILAVIMALFAVVSASMIANTSLMSVMERLGEFGTMRAIGLRSRDLGRLILAEGAVNGLAGALLGLAAGTAFVAFLTRVGVDLGGLMGSLGLHRYNRPQPDPLWYGACCLAGILVCLAATARAARAVRSWSVAESLASGAAA